MKVAKRKLKQIIKEELQAVSKEKDFNLSEEPLDEGLGDILQGIKNLFNKKYQQFKALATRLGDTKEFWEAAKPVIAQDGAAAVQQVKSGKGLWNFTSYLKNDRGEEVHIWKWLTHGGESANFEGPKQLGFGLDVKHMSHGSGIFNLEPSRYRANIGSGEAKVILDDIYSNNVGGRGTAALVWIAETVDVLAAITAIVDAGKATQDTVKKVENIRRFIQEEIINEIPDHTIGLMAGENQPRDPESWYYKAIAQINDNDKKNLKGILVSMQARAKELLGQAKALETKLINVFKKGAMQAELPRSAPELQERKRRKTQLKRIIKEELETVLSEDIKKAPNNVRRKRR